MTLTTETLTTDHRGGPRQRTLKDGMIFFGGGGISCNVRNLSPTGACLDVESIIGIPLSFYLMIGGEKTARACRIMWSQPRRIGVAFD